MIEVFADSGYFVGLLNPRDPYRELVQDVSTKLDAARLVTSELVIVETLNYLSRSRPDLRQAAAVWASGALSGRLMRVIRFSTQQLNAAIEHYHDRPDKFWSLTDCASMETMRRLGLNQVLSTDHHFEQAGFTILLKR